MPRVFLMLGTTRLREPSALVRSIAMPRLTASGSTSTGLPSTTAYEEFISGWSTSARTTAYPIRWVKLTLPPRPRARWLLITIRLSASSFAGTARTLVAVGTCSEASMFDTMRAATPRIGDVWAPAGAAGVTAGAALAGAAAAGAGAAAVGAGADGADGATAGAGAAGAGGASGVARA